ncbi:uncharacterized protein LOC128259795 [Drosophila gunungcola]|uniref:uncharacterized protein LOC128259795 n=1 Tax=Drosophila gunungcola TaxID=103775 RepID=UPI0022E86B66|nr:uncharacterized protein LOC128259795 [Drosophila gunungcola]
MWVFTFDGKALEIPESISGRYCVKYKMVTELGLNSTGEETCPLDFDYVSPYSRDPLSPQPIPRRHTTPRHNLQARLPKLGTPRNRQSYQGAHAAQQLVGRSVVRSSSLVDGLELRSLIASVAFRRSEIAAGTRSARRDPLPYTSRNCSKRRG